MTIVSIHHNQQLCFLICVYWRAWKITIYLQCSKSVIKSVLLLKLTTLMVINIYFSQQAQNLLSFLWLGISSYLVPGPVCGSCHLVSPGRGLVPLCSPLHRGQTGRMKLPSSVITQAHQTFSIYLNTELNECVCAWTQWFALIECVCLLFTVMWTLPAF